MTERTIVTKSRDKKATREPRDWAADVVIGFREKGNHRVEILIESCTLAPFGIHTESTSSANCLLLRVRAGIVVLGCTVTDYTWRGVSPIFHLNACKMTWTSKNSVLPTFDPRM